MDLDGHNPTGRPLIFARKPAPVQVEWLDWFDTSGMETIDAILTDPYTTPLDSPQRYAETPVRLPHARLCYTPVDDAPAVAPMPCLAGAPFTFGSFNRQDKLHPALLAVWAEILRAVPGSRLLLKNRALQVAAVRRSVEDELRAVAGSGPTGCCCAAPRPMPTCWANTATWTWRSTPFPTTAASPPANAFGWACRSSRWKALG